MAQEPRQTASCRALRTPQNPSGLFDTGFAGACSDDWLASAEEAFLTLDSDIFASLKTDAADDVTMATRVPLLSLSSEEGDLLPLETSVTENTDFCEVFTDLSSLLEESEQSEPPQAESTQVLPSTSDLNVTTSSRKRKALESDSAPVVNNDHADYTIKSKRMKISSVSEDEISSPSKDEKYRERRHKNNIASRRSREARKMKHYEMEAKAEELEKTNAELRSKVSQLEKLTKEMKDILVAKLAGK